MKKIIRCIVFGAIAFLLTYYGMFASFDKMIEDKMYHNPGNVSEKIRIIKIDDKTMNRLGEFSSWDREIYAELVEKLCVSDEIKPAVIGFDILFSSEKKEKTDKKFAEVCKKNGNVVCGFSYVFTKELSTDLKGNLISNSMSVQEKAEPYKKLKKATKQGFVNALMDNDDSVIRQTFLYFDEKDGERKKSFSSLIYDEYMDFLGKKATYPIKESIMSFRYTGGISAYENVSLCDVLDGTVPAETFDDTIVLVGAYAAGMMDAYFVPIDRGQQMYGVEIHANVIQALMEGKTLEALPKWVDILIAILISVLLVLICDIVSVRKGIVVCFVVVLLKFGIGAVLFNKGYSENNIVVPIMAILIGVYYIVINYYKARVARLIIEKAFNKYMAPEIVKEISKDGTFDLKLGGENRDIGVLFVDIRGFTSLSEMLEPEKVVNILNNYFELTTRCIFRHGGTLDKFVGDATMAVFNAPVDTDDYVYKAVLAAWDIVQGGIKMEKQFLSSYGKSVGFGVGVNCGEAIVGNIGCDFRMDYTAIGDTVNTAARLEANAPMGTVYISDFVYEKIKDRISVKDVGEIPLKGKSKGVYVYSVTGIKNYVSEEQ